MKYAYPLQSGSSGFCAGECLLRPNGKGRLSGGAEGYGQLCHEHRNPKRPPRNRKMFMAPALLRGPFAYRRRYRGPWRLCVQGARVQFTRARSLSGTRTDVSRADRCLPVLTQLACRAGAFARQLLHHRQCSRRSDE